jgi:hypothetical protein
MVPTVFIPVAVAARCYLQEALLWVAVNRYPIAHFPEHSIDAREDDEYVEGLEPYIPNDEPLSSDECAAAGLSSNPEREDFDTGDFHQTPENLRMIHQMVGLPDDDRKRIERELIEAEAFDERQKAWDAEFESYLDAPKARLFLALREGRVGAVGKPLPLPTYEASLVNLEAQQWEGWDNVGWQPIAHGFWISTKIDWFGCRADGKGRAYGLILVDCEQLFEHFPARVERLDQVVGKVGNALVLDDGPRTTAPRGLPRGRRPMDWDAFHLEVAQRLQEGALPAKQEAFVAEMQDWCRANWRKDVGRSTILSKLKPYYDAFVRTSGKLNKANS